MGLGRDLPGLYCGNLGGFKENLGFFKRERRKGALRKVGSTIGLTLTREGKDWRGL